MGTISQWSEIANVLYIPALAVMYGGWIIRFFQKWYSVMKLPDILLFCFGIVVFTVMAIPKFAPYFAPKTVVVHEQSQVLPINSLELTALRTENTKLKAENARLRKAQTPRVVSTPLPIPSACPSTKPILFPSQINAEDCDALTNAQKLVDIADQERVEAVKILSAGGLSAEQIRQTTTQAEVATATEREAMTNLARLEYRLCIIIAAPSPTPSGH